MLYLQENKFSFTAANFKNRPISDYCSECEATQQYGISVWVNKLAWVGSFETIFRVSNDPG